MKIMKKLKKNKLIVLVGLIYIVLLVFFPQYGIKAVKNSSYYLIEMLQVLPVIFLLIVIIEAWVPKEIIVKRFGKKSGFSGNILSLIFGSISAGPIYAAFPICKMLLKKGASITNIVIILSSWAVIKVPMLANEAKFLGVKFMTVRWLLTVIAIFIMAYLSALIVKKNELPNVQANNKSKVLFEIKESYCMGCGVCVKMLPEFYEMVDHKARIKTIPKEREKIKLVQSSVESCPMNAIVYYKGDI